MIRWRIYYDDGSTYSNDDGPWVDAPQHGVVCVVVRDPTEQWGRWVISGYSKDPNSKGILDKRHPVEMYVKYPDDEEPFATGHISPFTNRLRAVFEIIEIASYVKYGRECSQEKWQAIMAVANKDPDFPIGTPRRRATDQ